MVRPGSGVGHHARAHRFLSAARWCPTALAPSRYAARWSIEVTFFDVKNILGVEQARNRVRKAVQQRRARTATDPYALLIEAAGRLHTADSAVTQLGVVTRKLT